MPVRVKKSMANDRFRLDYLMNWMGLFLLSALMISLQILFSYKKFNFQNFQNSRMHALKSSFFFYIIKIQVNKLSNLIPSSLLKIISDFILVQNIWYNFSKKKYTIWVKYTCQIDICQLQ